MILGAVFLILITVGGGFVGYFFYAGAQLDASSKAYVDASVPPIISTWSEDELVKRASPQLRKATSAGQLNHLFSDLAKLGTFQSYDGAKGEANMSFTSNNGKMITASYLANATFQYGKIDIRINLIQNNGEWMILGFHVARHQVDSAN